MELNSALLLIWRRKWLPIGLALIAALSALAITLLRPEEDKVRAGVLLFVPEAQTGRPETFLQMQVGTFTSLAKTDGVATAVIEQTGLDMSPDQFHKRMAVNGRDDGAVTFTFRYEDADVSRKVVDAAITEVTRRYQDLLRQPALGVAKQYTERIAALEPQIGAADAEISGFLAGNGLSSANDAKGAQEVQLNALNRKRDALVTELEGLKEQLTLAQAQELEAVSRVQIQPLGAATVLKPSRLSDILKVGVAALLGGLLGGFIALGLGVYGRGVTSIEEAEEITGLQVLATLPYFEPGFTTGQKHGRSREKVMT